jgi:uncharacterized protein YvpB
MKNSLTTRVAAAALAGAAALAALAGTTATAYATPAPVIQPTPAPPFGQVYGDAKKAAQWWAMQSEGDCGLMTVAVLVGEMTATEPSEPNILAVAEHTPSVDPHHKGQPIYTPAPDAHHPNDSSGTTPADMVVLLAHYGIHAQLIAGTGKDMEKALAEGRGVIAAVNAEVLEGKTRPHDNTNANHVVVVTEIDTINGMVHLNNTGIETGRDEQVPLERFAQAWKTSGYTMIVTDQTTN